MTKADTLVANTLRVPSHGASWRGDGADNFVAVQAFGGNNTSGPIDCAAGLNAKGGAGRMDFDSETFIAHSLRGEGFDASEDGTGRGTPLVPVAFDCKAGQHFTSAEDHTPTLRSMNGAQANGGGQLAVAFNWQQGGDHTTSLGLEVEHTPTLQRSQSLAVQSAMQVRRLTPRECERLQGFPDDYTAIPHRGKPAADGPRYKALGNSWAVPCAAWIGRRIDAVEAVERRQAA